MPAPWAELAVAITGRLAVAGITSNVYDSLRSKLTAPGVLIRPDEPWIEPASFEHYRERYLAVCFVGSSSPAEATAKLAKLIGAVLAALEGSPDWSFDRVSAPRLDDSTGVSYLASAIALTVSKPIP